MSEVFELHGKHSLYWLNEAIHLHDSAGALWVSQDADVANIIKERANFGNGNSTKLGLHWVYEMLCGMSLELAFKAITLERGEKINTRGHDLTVHLKTTGLDYNQKEIELLKIYTQAIRWAGRYPTPKEASEMDAFHALVRENLYNMEALRPGGTLKMERPNGALEWEGYTALWDKALSRYNEAHTETMSKFRFPSRDS